MVTFHSNFATIIHTKRLRKVDLPHHRNHNVTVGIVGLGYVGLPLAVAFAEAGVRTVGIDADSRKVASLNSGESSGESYIEGLSMERLAPLLSVENLRIVERHDALAEADIVVICLPTPLDRYREPDLSIVVAGAEEVSRHIRPETLVVLESTTYPGTTRELLLPIFERGNRRVGEDFYLAYCPERVDVANQRYNIENTPRIVGGITAECTRRAQELYKLVCGEVIPVSSPEIAELSKLLENVFRSVNIALINELAVLCHRMGIDVWEVADAAKTKPFGFMPFYPGPGLGGHCIPIDPFYLSWRARAFDMNMEFVELAGRTNTNMPYYVTERIAAALNSMGKPVTGSRILVLGVSYKPNVGDLRESPALKILSLLTASGARASYHDPHVPHLPDGSSSMPLDEEEISRADCVVIATGHDSIDLRPVVEHAVKVVDLRNAVRLQLGHLPANVEVL